MADLWNWNKGQWRDFSNKMTCLWNISVWLKVATKQHLAGLQKAKGTIWAPNEDFSHWEWQKAKTAKQKQLSSKKA